jgi:hypothetical protein
VPDSNAWDRGQCFVPHSPILTGRCHPPKVFSSG